MIPEEPHKCTYTEIWEASYVIFPQRANIWKQDSQEWYDPVASDMAPGNSVSWSSLTCVIPSSWMYNWPNDLLLF